MSVDRDTLVRYLRERAELGERQFFLDALTRPELLALLRSRPAPAEQVASGVGEPGPSPASGTAQVQSGDAVPGKPRHERRDHPQLTVLREQALACTACRLAEGRNNVVFGVGDPAAELMVVGEAPGQDEDRKGEPFVGQAGKLLDLLLMTAGFPRDSVYICNVLKCRPPNNRNPLPDEVDACASFLRGQLEMIAPKVLLAVGKFAAQSLLQTEESIGRLRGTVHSFRGTPVIVTYHPAYLLRSPQATRIAWQDFQLMRRVLDEQG